MNVALYARVSTDDRGQDPELQLRELRAACERQRHVVIAEYVDVGFSGAKENRPQLIALMADAATKKFDCVMVWKFDRFARSAAHLLRALDTFNSLGLSFVSLTEGIDTSTLVGKMVYTVLGAVAEMERGLTIERIRAGMRNAKSKGKHVGRPSVTVDLSTLADLRTAGLSNKACAARLGISESTLRNRRAA